MDYIMTYKDILLLRDYIIQWRMFHHRSFTFVLMTSFKESCIPLEFPVTSGDHVM